MRRLKRQIRRDRQRRLAALIRALTSVILTTNTSGPPNFWPWPWNLVFSRPVTVQTKAVALLDKLRSRHVALFAGTGAGKTKLIEILVLMDLARRVSGQSRRGGVIIDTNGDMINESLRP